MKASRCVCLLTAAIELDQSIAFTPYVFEHREAVVFEEREHLTINLLRIAAPGPTSGLLGREFPDLSALLRIEFSHHRSFPSRKPNAPAAPRHCRDDRRAPWRVLLHIVKT